MTAMYDEIRAYADGQAARLRLNRPRALQHGAGQSRHAAAELGPGQAQRHFVQRGCTQLHAEYGGESACVTGVEEIFDGGQRVAAPLEPAYGGKPVQVGLAVDADAALPPGRRQQAQRLVLADGADRKVRPLGELVNGELHRLHSLGIGHA